MTWQLRRLHVELDGIDKQRGDGYVPTEASMALAGRGRERDHAARRILLDRMLRSLPKHFGFRDAASFARAFLRATQRPAAQPARRRLGSVQVRELERRVLKHEKPAEIARDLGCAEQTVLNRATKIRKRIAAQFEADASGI